MPREQWRRLPEAGYQAIAMLPLIPIYDSNNEGGYGGPTSGMPDPTNPVGYNKLTTDHEENDHIMASVYGEYEIFDNLNYKFQGSHKIDEFHYMWYAPTYQMGYVDINEKAYLWEYQSKKTHTILDQTLSYNNTFGKHNISGLLGYSEEKTDYRRLGASVRNFPSNEIRVLEAGKDDPGVFGYAYEYALRSFFSRISYSYADKYLLQVNIRRDGSSRFSENNKWGTFPSASLGWRMSKESFFKSVPYVNNFKIRASYGVLGNQEIGNYTYIPGIASGGDWINELGYVFGRSQEIYPGSTIREFPALDVQWETTKKTDIGFDIGLLNDKLMFTADYYIEKTSDMLVEVPIPKSAGVTEGPVSNFGEMQNKGLEFSTQYRKAEGEFNYSISASITTYNNEILKLGKEDEAIWGGAVTWDTPNTTKSEVGGEIGSFWLYQTDGIFQSQEEIDSYVNANGDTLQPLAAPGDIRFKDTNGDGVINDDDKVNMGSAIPEFEYGINFNASYKNFDFSLQIHGVSGRKLYNGMKFKSERMHSNLNYAKSCLDAWTPENTNTDVPRAVFGDPNGNTRPSDRYLEDGSYLRFKHIELGYTLPNYLLPRLGVGSLRIYVSAENLWTITDYTGYDPGMEGGNASNNLFDRGVDRALYPIAKTFLFGVQLGIK